MSNGIGHNNLNDISKIYLDTISDINKKEQDADVERWQNEAVKGEDTQRRKDAAAERREGKGKLLSKKAGESYAKWTMRKHPKEVDEDAQYGYDKKGRSLNPKDIKKRTKKEEKYIVDLDPDEDVNEKKYQREGKLTSVKATTYGMPAKERQILIDKERERQGVKPKPTKEEFSNWRNDLREITSDKIVTKDQNDEEIKEKKVKNKIVINPQFKEAVKEIGGELLEVKEFSEDTEKYLTPNERAKYEVEKRKAVKKKKAKEAKKKQEEARKTAKGKQRATGNLKKHDADGDGYVKVIDAGYEPQGELIEAPEEDSVDAKDEKTARKEKTLKLRLLRLKMMATRQGADDSIVAHYEPEIEGAVQYFYEQGINEEGLEQIIEEVGLDDFVEFVLDTSEVLTEDWTGPSGKVYKQTGTTRDARKMNVRSLKSAQKKAAETKADRSDVVKRGTPKDTLARAKAERASKKTKLAKPSAPKKPAKPVAPKKPAAPKKPSTKKVVKSVAKVKKTQPAKKPDKGGLRKAVTSTLTKAYKSGVKRHRKATQPIRVLHKGAKQAPKAVGKFMKQVKGVLDANKSKTVNMQSYEPEGDTLSEVQVTRIGDAQQKAMQDAVLKRKEDLKKKEKEKVKESNEPTPCVKNEAYGGKGVSRKAKLASLHPPTAQAAVKNIPKETDRGAGNKAMRRAGKTVEKKSPTYLAHVHNKEEVELQERPLDTFEKGEKERVVKGMKKDTAGFKKRYGKKWKSVMYATATKQAKEAGDTSKSDKRYAYESIVSRIKESATNPKKFDLEKWKERMRKKEGAVFHGDPGTESKKQPKPKPKKDTRTPEQKKADQEKANIDAVYGRTLWNKKGSLGT